MVRERPARRFAHTLGLAVLLAWSTPASAQILGAGRSTLPVGAGLPGGLGAPRIDPGGLATPRAPITSALSFPAGISPLNAADALAATPLSQVRRLTAARLLREHSDVIEADDHGQPVVRGEILAVGIDRDTLARLRQAGFAVRSQNALGDLGIEAVVLGAPRGQSAVQAIGRLRALDPAGAYDFNHLYQQAGVGAETSGASKPPAPDVDARGLRIGLVDGSAAQSRPALARTRMVQRSFAPGGEQISAHATAVASLIAGTAGPFHGSAPGATLYVADVYGPTPTGGSAQAISQALAWLAQSKTPVINISLVGPSNLLLEAAVHALIARGITLVAAVGNDGPAAPPLYPAAYPGVVAVTGVDAHGRVLPEAGRGTHVDFAAPGADMAAAGLDGGYVSVRGTSFAAPIVAGRLALLRARGSSAEALEALAHEAVDLGAPGPDPVYGRGLVGAEVRTDPAALRNAR